MNDAALGQRKRNRNDKVKLQILADGKAMNTVHLQVLLVASLVVGLNQQGWAQDPDIGKTEYQSSCAACHGVDGKGTGPLAEELKTKPTDLTMIAKNNSGVFPLNRVYETVDGRQRIKSHGVREMPIWGFRYTPSAAQGLSFSAANNYIDPFYDPEAVTRRRILALVDYIYRIQVK